MGAQSVECERGRPADLAQHSQYQEMHFVRSTLCRPRWTSGPCSYACAETIHTSGYTQMSDLESLLKELGPEQDPALPSVERILAGLHDERFSGIVHLEYKSGRVISMRKRQRSNQR